MKCPKCGNKARVVQSREMSATVYRRRQCDECGQRFTTYEMCGGEQEVPLHVKCSHGVVTLKLGS